MNNILDKIINSKITWLILSIIIILLTIILFLPIKKEDTSVNIDKNIINKDENKDSPITSPDKDEEDDKEINYFLNLKGDLEISLYTSSKYVEPGYSAYDDNGADLTSSVVISGTVDTSKVGVYELIYTLKIGNKELKKSRIIKVIKEEVKDISLTLNGSETIYLPLNAKYQEYGAKAYLDNLDISNDLEINNNVNNKKVGTYTVLYKYQKDNINKSITRKVIVYDLDALFTYNKIKTNDNVTIKISQSDYFSYIVLPDKTISKEKGLTYIVTKNGEYTFLMYDKNGNEYKKIINITNIDKTAPQGNCYATLLDGKTTFQTVSLDNDIKKYTYNNVYSTTNGTYVVNKFIRNSYVILTDEVGNQTKINCKTELKTLPVITPKEGETVKYTAKSDSLVLYITKNGGYYLTRIWAKDPVYQMKKQLVSGDDFKKPKTILKEAVNQYNLTDKIVFGGNASAPIKIGSYYSAVAKSNNLYNLKEPSALLIYNGEVIINDYQKYSANTTIFYLDGSNQLQYIPKLRTTKTPEERKVIFQNAINSGAYNTYTFGPILVDNYKEQDAGEDYNAYRQGFCQIDSNNFILVTSDTKRWERQDFAKFMQKLGCKTAANFDGGGSVALFYKPKGESTITTLAGNERSLSSVMYFTELD